MLDETDGRSEVVEKPAEATIVEVDDAQVRFRQQQIGQPQVRVNQSEALRTRAELLDPAADEAERLLQRCDTRRIEADGRTPRTPVAIRPHHGLEVPAPAAKPGRQGPRACMRMHPRAQFAQPLEPVDAVAGARLTSGQALEGDGEAARS